MDEIYARLDNLNEIDEEITEPSEIQDFFNGQTIFLTGSTGFLGKIFLEKLLRSCRGVKRVYMMVRPKKLPSNERMQQYLDSEIFSRLKVEYPDFQSKITILEGDLFKEDLGISAKDRARLVEETTLIFHNASNVKFEEKINVGIRVNVFGTKYMLELAKQCKKLVGFMYISTAYSHCYQQHIEEKFYNPPGDLTMMKQIMESGDSKPDGVSDEELKRILGPWRNSYVFTKSTAESLVEQCGKEAPFACVVFRPSMVISTYLEPIRSWCGNLNGPIGAIIGNCLGFIHGLYKGWTTVDYVPADMCGNAMLTTMWDAVANEKVKNRAIVYNYGSSTVNRITVSNLKTTGYARGADAPSIHMMGPYYVTETNCIWNYWFLHLTTPLFTALFADFVLLCKGQKPQAMSYWILLTKNFNSLIYFSTSNWRIHIHRTVKLWDRMNRRDSKLFFCDLRKLDWVEFAYSFWAGLRVYTLKDPMSTIEVSLKKRRTIELTSAIFVNFFRILMLYFVGRWLLNTFVPTYF